MFWVKMIMEGNFCAEKGGGVTSVGNTYFEDKSLYKYVRVAKV